jgi:hypothetical protein
MYTALIIRSVEVVNMRHICDMDERSPVSKTFFVRASVFSCVPVTLFISHSKTTTNDKKKTRSSSLFVSLQKHTMDDQGPTSDAQCPTWAASLGYMGVAAAVCLSNWGSAVS